MIRIGFSDRIVQSHGIPTLNSDENRMKCQSSQKLMFLQGFTAKGLFVL